VLEYRMIRAAFEAAPTDPFYLKPLEDVVLTRLGDAHGMIALAQTALGLDPSSAPGHEALARAASALGKDDLAAAHAAKARALRAATAGPARPR
jgi:hypothetical protein